MNSDEAAGGDVEDEEPLGQFENAKIGPIFDCGAGIRSAMIKWMVPGDLAHQIGLGWDSHEYFASDGGV